MTCCADTIITFRCDLNSLLFFFGKVEDLNLLVVVDFSF